MVKLKQLLQQYMYKDRATVYRALQNKNGWGADSNKIFDTIYENIPCHLCQYGKELSASRDDRAQTITEDLRLDYSPEYEILENDVIDVKRGNTTFKLVAGTEFFYPTHKELSVRRRKEARQS